MKREKTCRFATLEVFPRVVLQLLESSSRAFAFLSLEKLQFPFKFTRFAYQMAARSNEQGLRNWLSN